LIAALDEFEECDWGEENTEGDPEPTDDYRDQACQTPLLKAVCPAPQADKRSPKCDHQEANDKWVANQAEGFILPPADVTSGEGFHS
jgi:hypothetical protein